MGQLLLCSAVAAMACSGEAPPAPPAHEAQPPDSPPPSPERPDYDGEIWCAARDLAGRKHTGGCAVSEEECKRQAVGAETCERSSSGAARQYLFRFSRGEWLGPRLVLYGDIAECIRASNAPSSLDDYETISSACVPLRDEAFASLVSEQRLAEMQSRSETTRSEIWCFTVSEIESVWCHEGRRRCDELRQTSGPDRGIDVTPCERRDAVFGYSYRSVYGNRMRSLYGTPRECDEALARARENNRRGAGRRSHLTECYELRTAARPRRADPERDAVIDRLMRGER